MKKLFVGNLSWKATEENLKAHFESVGTVLTVRIIVDIYTGKSKGFGFVEMETPEAAQRAIQELNEKPFMDRPIRVNLALERAERSGSGGGGNGSGYGGGSGGGYGGGGGGGRRDYNRGGNDGQSRPYRPRQPERAY